MAQCLTAASKDIHAENRKKLLTICQTVLVGALVFLFVIWIENLPSPPFWVAFVMSSLINCAQTFSTLATGVCTPTEIDWCTFSVWPRFLNVNGTISYKMSFSCKKTCFKRTQTQTMTWEAQESSPIYAWFWHHSAIFAQETMASVLEIQLARCLVRKACSGVLLTLFNNK